MSCLLLILKKIFIKHQILQAFLKEKHRVENIPSYKKGNWWVQDFASFLSLSNLSPKQSTSKYIDLCSAPGGKAFQILSKK